MKRHYLIGLLFLVMEFIALATYRFSNPLVYIWFCNFIPLLFSISFFTKKWQFVKALINFGLIYQIIYLVYMVFHFKISTYVIISFFLHFSSLLALLFVYKIKTDKKSIVYSLILTMMIYSITFVLAPRDSITNYVHSPGLIASYIPILTSLFYPLVWFTIPLLMIVLTYFLQIWIYKMSIKSKVPEENL